MTLFGVLVLATVVAVANGAVSIAQGPCPENVNVGDEWDEPNCVSCSCFDGYYTCSSCGAMEIDYDKENCRLEIDLTLPPPDCCFPAVVCNTTVVKVTAAPTTKAPHNFLNTYTKAPKNEPYKFVLFKDIHKKADTTTKKATPKPTQKTTTTRKATTKKPAQLPKNWFVKA
ncbi:uncharacterized protein LOC131931362 [Physella acuta]|uniref:uncharacterized protein LOC131931362 n=1 Tax=Physella acuta TaxID=109671 RepID=UPI0027DBC404|nr:uncharacterized protein LOC131931362 [Physella acuta]